MKRTVVAVWAAAPDEMEVPENPFVLAREWEQTITAKEDVIAKLKESIAYAKNAIATFPADQLDETVQLFEPPMSKRAGLLVLLSHSLEPQIGPDCALALRRSKRY